MKSKEIKTMTREEIINEYLQGFKKETIDELPDTVLLGLIDEFYPPVYGGAGQIYKESNKEERKALIADIKKVIRGEAGLRYLFVENEGVRTKENEESFAFARKHSVWYEVTPIR